MRPFVGFLLSATSFGSVPDECQWICDNITGSCGRKGSYCKNGYDCMDLFWFSDGEFGVLCNSNDSDCAHLSPVLCSEAEAIRSGSRPNIVSFYNISRSAIDLDSDQVPVAIPLTVGVPLDESASPLSGLVGVRGIMNLGGSCYFSSVLQVLVHSHYLRSSLLFKDWQHLSPVALAFSTFLRHAWEYSPDSLSPLDAEALLARVREFNGGDGFAPTVADDASWAADVLIAALSPYSKDFDMTLRIDSGCAGCDSASTRTEVRRSHLVSFTDYDGSNTLAEMLNAHFGDTAIADFTCDVCGAVGVTRRTLTITSMPKVLVITANRYILGEEKVENSIGFPLKLDLGTVARVSTDEPESSMYRLMGIINHKGEHYTTDFMHPDSGAWYHADDSRVTPIRNTPELIGTDPFVIVYEIDS